MKISPKLVVLFLIATAAVLNSCEKSEPEISTSDRDKFIGEYNAYSDGPGGHRNFNLSISASASSPTQIKLVNFDDSNGTTVFADVSGSSLSIPTQSVSGETYKGTGSLSGKTLTINFTVDDSQTVESRVLTGLKQ